MSVAAWGPLAGGVLSGKFTRPGGAGAGIRISPDTVSERDHTAARTVQSVADELGVTCSQVAIAWTGARSKAVHPIIGARTVEQLTDNLAALDCTLSDEAIQRLDAVTGFTRRVPGRLHRRDRALGLRRGVSAEWFSSQII